MRKVYLAAFNLLFLSSLQAQTGPIFEAWMYNTTGQTANYDTQNTSETLTELADISSTHYDNDYVYVSAEGLASYTMGPWSVPFFYVEGQGYVYKLPRNPEQNTGSLRSVPTGGTVGAAVNGVPFYGNRSAESYDASAGSNSFTGDDVWHADAWVTEGQTMDESGTGHPANGRYHYHARPSALDDSDGSHHSDIVGFALDGYPVYGPYGYDNPNDANSDIVLIQSSYDYRNITERKSLPDGTVLSDPNSWGPDVTNNGQWDIGTFVEDYQYNDGSGHLDQYNGRWCVTPEYPEGTYAYFTTFKSAEEPAFPYIFADYYYGVVPTGQTGNTAIPNGAEEYDPLTAVTMVNVTFQVLIPADSTVSSVALAGEFNSWSTSDVDYAMTLESGMVYTVTTSLAAGSTHEYKFVVNDGWENVDGTCTVGDFANREITIGSSDITLDLSCLNTCDACDDLTVGLEETSEFMFKAYPNPVVDVLTIEGGENRANQVVVYDVVGNIILAQLFEQQTTLDVSDFGQGVYVLALQSGQEVQLSRVLKR